MKNFLIGILVLAVIAFGYLQFKPKEKGINIIATENPEKRISNINKTFVSEINANIELPTTYSIKPGSEFEWFKSFEITPPISMKPPYLTGIAFYTKDSINQFKKDCDLSCIDNMEFDVDPDADLALFASQKEMFDMKNFQDENVKYINGRNWLVSDEKCIGDTCSIRTYTTFINGVKISTFVTGWYIDNETNEEVNPFPEPQTTQAFQNLTVR